MEHFETTSATNPLPASNIPPRMHTAGFPGAPVDPTKLQAGTAVIPIANDLQWLYDRTIATPSIVTNTKQLVERVSRLEYVMREAIDRHDANVPAHHVLGELPQKCIPCLLFKTLQRDDLGSVVYSSSGDIKAGQTGQIGQTGQTGQIGPLESIQDGGAFLNKSL
jgi:hypothetical protein